jgi:hypothetical protein
MQFIHGISGANDQSVFTRGSQLQSQQYDDVALFQRLSLIVICCGPPALHGPS